MIGRGVGSVRRVELGTRAWMSLTSAGTMLRSQGVAHNAGLFAVYKRPFLTAAFPCCRLLGSIHMWLFSGVPQTANPPEPDTPAPNNLVTV